MSWMISRGTRVYWGSNDLCSKSAELKAKMDKAINHDHLFSHGERYDAPASRAIIDPLCEPAGQRKVERHQILSVRSSF